MLRTFVCLLFSLYTYNTVYAQVNESPYLTAGKQDLSLFAIGAGLGATAYILNGNISPLTSQDVNRLNSSDVFQIDRFATRNYSTRAKAMSDRLQLGSFMLPLTFLLPKKTRKDFLIIGLMSMETALITHGITAIFKSSVQRVRPLVYNEEVPLDEKLSKNSKRSFFSGHTSNFAALSFFTAKVISDYSNNKTVKIVAWSTAASTSFLMGYLRVKAGKHFTSDVIVGYAVGATIGYIIPEIHKKLVTENFAILPYSSFDSMGVSLRIGLK